MPTLVGDLSSVGLIDLPAKLTITLDVPVSTEDLVGNKILLLPYTDSWIITDGNLENSNINVIETETSKVSVRIQIFLTNPGSSPVTYQSDPVFNIQTTIPNIAEVNIATLVDTGYTNDTVSTGAYRVAKEMLTNPFLLRLFNEYLDFYRGDNPPTVEDINAKPVIWQNSQTLEFYEYDPTLNLWLGRLWQAQSNSNNFGGGNSNASLIYNNFFRSKENVGTNRKILMKELNIDYSLANANTATNFWTINYLYKNWNSGSFTSVPGTGTYDTKNKAANTKHNISYLFPNTLASVVDLDVLHYYGATFIATLNANAPGSIFFNLHMSFRPVIEATP